MEQTSRAIIKINQEYVFMKRNKIVDGKINEYYATIGGHLDENETYEEACMREVYEELGVECKINELFYESYNEDLNRYEKFYLVTLLNENFTHGNGPEFSNINFEKYGSYEIIRINKDELQKYRILPVEIKKLIIEKE